MAHFSSLQVARIPCDTTDASRIYLTDLPLIDINEGIDKNQRKDFEENLQLIPNLKLLQNPKNFSWAHRHLIGFTNFQIGYGESWKGDYWMYVCVDEKSGLQQNEYLKKLVAEKQGRVTLMPEIKVFGDAIVFRTRSNDVSERTDYMHMEKEFLPHGLSWSFGDSLLFKFLMYPHKGEWKHPPLGA